MTLRRDGIVAIVVASLWFLTAIGQASVAPEAEVKVLGGRLHIQATATPVSVVLDRLSRATGMKVVYEGAPPSDRLTAAIDAGSETEALSRLLEGLGLTYAFKLDASGRHVETLFVTAASSSARRASSSPIASAPSPMAALDQDMEEDVPTAENAPVPEMAGDPAAGQPGAPGMTPYNPGYTGAPPILGTPGFEDHGPTTPGAASFPQPPGTAFPTPPIIPGPASYPSTNVGL